MPVPVVTNTYTFTAPPLEEALARDDNDGPPVHLAPLSQLLSVHAEDVLADEKIRRKSDRITGMDMRFQRYRKAEP